MIGKDYIADEDSDHLRLRIMEERPELGLEQAVEHVFDELGGWAKACSAVDGICLNEDCGCFQRRCLLHERPGRGRGNG